MANLKHYKILVRYSHHREFVKYMESINVDRRLSFKNIKMDDAIYFVYNPELSEEDVIMMKLTLSSVCIKLEDPS